VTFVLVVVASSDLFSVAALPRWIFVLNTLSKK